MYAGRYKNRYVGRPNRFGRKAKRGGSAATQLGAGSGRHLVPRLRPPAIPRFERMLDRVGMPMQRFRQFRSEERLNVTPESGRCFWYGVPEYMEYGNPMDLAELAVGADAENRWILKQSPNSCDLFDIYKNLGAGVSSNNNDYGPDTRSHLAIIEGHKPGVAFNFGPYGTQSTGGTTGVELYKQIPSYFRVLKPGLDYTMRTSITYDNVSSLDAFVEVYCLEYTAPASVNGDQAGYQIGKEYTPSELCVSNWMDKAPLEWKYQTLHPGKEFCPIPVPTVLAPVNAQMKRYSSAMFAGCMLRAFADACRVQRVPAYAGRLLAADLIPTTLDLAPAEEGSVLNSVGRGTIANPTTVQSLLCHPKNDPLRTTPPTRSPAKMGFRMHRVQAARRIKPGNSMKFDIPSSGTRFWSYLDSPIGAKEGNQTVSFIGAGTERAEVKKTRIYYFRVWGDMIHSKVDRDDGFETDWQTGSTSVTFQTQRVVWARQRTRYNTTINPTLMAFDTPTVSVGQQEMINPETGAPQLVVNMGDDTI